MSRMWRQLAAAAREFRGKERVKRGSASNRSEHQSVIPNDSGSAALNRNCGFPDRTPARDTLRRRQKELHAFWSASRLLVGSSLLRTGRARASQSSTGSTGSASADGRPGRRAEVPRDRAGDLDHRVGQRRLALAISEPLLRSCDPDRTDQATATFEDRRRDRRIADHGFLAFERVPTLAAALEII